ncbi:E3 ubiquitin-protein ligase UBR3 [Halotydeus destructor]|nr:E3 ubiquitin-protein ligase UBR3 [Halotydeus destructor]
MAASDYEPSDGLLKKGKKTTAKNVQTECSKSDKKEDHKQLNQLLDQLLDPRKPISDSEIIEWLRWLIAGGSSPDDYAQSVKEHDNATTCGLVWTANFVAYRCRTCGISPCMSLCAECFQKGDHEGHDFNMFRSQAGGACDCGDPSVMKEQGFCVRHGPKASKSTPCPPSGLLCVAKAMLPRLLHRLLVQLRKNNADALKEADGFITNILTQMTDMGAAMRTVMSEILISPEIYSSLSNKCDARELEMSVILHDRFENYVSAKKAMTSFKPAAGFLRDCTICNKDVCVISGFEKELVHNSYAEEFLFWTIVYEFPQKLVCFLLNMLPDIRYKEAFAESFVHHYSRVSIMLAKFRNLDDTPGTNRPSAHDLLSNCVVHVSVQLFSNETLAAKLCREQHLLHVIIASLRATVEGSPSVTGAADDVRGILTPSRLQVASRNRHQVVRCDHYIMRKHSYWPLVSDLNNILTHSPVAHMFMGDSTIFQMWLEFVLNFQGMNLNIRELDEHVEYENESYYAAFSAELEICATPIWTLISHLRDDSTWRLSNNVIRQTQECLEKWFDLISFTNYDTPNAYQATFHFPLHRYYAIFLHHAVQRQSLSLSSLLPFCESKLQLYLAHPLQVLVAFYEILCGLWVRNGLQMKGQAMTYIQCHFCNSMVDPDLFLIQQCASRLSPDWFIQTVLERFHVWDWLSLSPNQDQSYRRAPLEPDQIMPMLEGALTFLSTFFSVRTNLGLSEEEVTRQEMVTLLTMGDRTHSQLMDLLPEKCGTTSQTKDFEKMLARVADYRAPSLESGGNLSQGTFSPKSDVWEDEFDPIHVLLRAVHRRDYQASMDRYTTHMKQNGKWPSTSLPWPPFRQPKDADGSKFIDPRKVLYSKVLHGVLFTILYKAMYVCDVTDQVLALAVYLLEMSLSYPSSESTSPVPSIGEMSSPLYVQDRKFSDWFTSESILVNFNTNIQMVTCPNVYHERDSVALSCSQESDGPSVEEMEVGPAFEFK